MTYAPVWGNLIVADRAIHCACDVFPFDDAITIGERVDARHRPGGIYDTIISAGGTCKSPEI